MMTNPALFDLLLEFLSARGAGGWIELKEAVLAAVAGSGEAPRGWHPTIVAEQLVALGHLEIAFDGDLRWAMCPAALVSIAGEARAAVLCGRRTHDLVERVHADGRQLGAEVRLDPERLAPSRLAITAPSPLRADDVAAALNLPLHVGAAGRLLRVLPTLGSILNAAPVVAPPTGYETRRFDPAALTWAAVDRVHADGSYKIDCYRPEFYVVRGGQPRRVSRGLAVHHALAAAGRAVLAYAERDGSLSVPAGLRLPILYTRALALCRCSAPEYCPDAGRLRFGGVDPAFAALLNEKLRTIEV
jgi:hypothetical protein